MVLALAVIGTGILSWVIGFACGVSKSDPFPCSHWDYDLKATRMSLLETQLYRLEQEQRRLSSYIHYNPCHTHSYTRDVKLYAQTQEQQEIVDIAKKVILSTDELAKKLGVK